MSEKDMEEHGSQKEGSLLRQISLLNNSLSALLLQECANIVLRHFDIFTFFSAFIADGEALLTSDKIEHSFSITKEDLKRILDSDDREQFKSVLLRVMT